MKFLQANNQNTPRTSSIAQNLISSHARHMQEATGSKCQHSLTTVQTSARKMRQGNGWTTPPEERASHPHGNGRLGTPCLRPTGLELSQEDKTTTGTIPFPQTRRHTVPQTNTHGTPADRKARPPHTFLSHAQTGPGLLKHELHQQPKNQCTERSIHQSKKPGSPQERQFTSCSKDQPT